MIVPAIRPVPDSAEYLPVFDVVAAAHDGIADEYRVVTQPDHARLSGMFAREFDPERFPFLTDEVLLGIAAHDAGWLELDGVAPEPILPPVQADGRLRSFLTTEPDDFLRAWSGSISRAQEIGPLAGAMVGRHFELIARYRLNQAVDTPENVQKIEHFSRDVSERQARLESTGGFGAKLLEQAVRVLQFCDLVSLYVCCESRQPVRFPQSFDGSEIRIRWSGKGCEMLNSPMRTPVSGVLPTYRWKPGWAFLEQDRIAVNVIPAI